LTITNSEVGASSVDIQEFIWRLVCANGAIGQSLLRSYHVGARIDYENSEIFQNDTIEAEMKSFTLRLRDVMADAVSQTRLDMTADKMRSANQDKIYKPAAMMKEVTKYFSISDSDGDLILSNMIENNSMTRYGLMNGITALAHRIENADKQYEVEKLGMQIIDLKPHEWMMLNVA
jgi:hypothetical protein